MRGDTRRVAMRWATLDAQFASEDLARYEGGAFAAYHRPIAVLTRRFARRAEPACLSANAGRIDRDASIY